ncbi:uncharacterized protein TM35_000021640, partial [Trypanosoma theileri]
MEADVGMPSPWLSSPRHPLSGSSSGPDYPSADVNVEGRDSRYAADSSTKKIVNETPVGKMKYGLPPLDAETRNLVARMRDLVYNQRRTDEVKINKP